MSLKRKILFVCTGNSCRSVMAEGLLRHIMEERGRKDIQVMSAGTGAMPGMGPTLETVEVMWTQGVEVSSHLSQPLDPDLVRHADAVFCLEDFHRDAVLALDPKAESKTFLLRNFEKEGPHGERNIPDPIGQPLEVYEACAKVIKEAVMRVADWIEKP